MYLEEQPIPKMNLFLVGTPQIVRFMKQFTSHALAVSISTILKTCFSRKKSCFAGFISTFRQFSKH